MNPEEWKFQVLIFILAIWYILIETVFLILEKLVQL